MDYKRGEINIPAYVGRNEPCPCGSGKKFKKCCLPIENGRTAQLSADDCKFFFSTFFKMLGYVNAQLNVTAHKFNPKSSMALNRQEALAIRNKLWENPHLIGEYAKFMGFSQEASIREIELLKSWGKNYIKGQFVILKYTADYAVFAQIEEGNICLYAVKGLTDSVAFLTKKQAPIMVNTAIMPFEGKIIYDGLVAINPDIEYPDELVAATKKDYSDLVAEFGLITKL